MNALLWGVQAFLALHTAIGAVWKLSNPAVPSLAAIPQGVWLGLSGAELLCSLGLMLPALYSPAARLVPLAAGFIAAEMLVFCGLHIASGDGGFGPVIYWLVVAAVCMFVVQGRRRGA